MAAWFSSTAGTILWRYLKIVGPTLQCVLKVPYGVIHNPLEHLRSSLFAEASRGPIFIALWTTDHINLLALAFTATDFKAIAQDFTFLVDDSLGGRIVGEALKREHLQCLSIRRADPAGRLKDLRGLLDLSTPLVLVVDGHGPYYEVGTGLLSLAKALGGVIWPCSARARRALIIPNTKIRLELPTVYSTIEVTIGDPVICRPEDSAKQLASILRQRMEAARNLP